MEKRPLTLTEYNRIYQTAHGVLESIATPEKACIFFASFGAYILNKHYKIPARPVAGGFALCVNDDPKVAFFGKIDGEKIDTARDGFHMWVQTKTHIIDFMAPLFPEAFAEKMSGISLPRKMLQRAIVTEAADLNGLKVAGDFISLPDSKLTEALSNDFLAKPINTDLLLIAERWFGSPSGNQKKTYAMMDNRGQVEQLSLPTTVIVGSW